MDKPKFGLAAFILAICLYLSLQPPGVQAHEANPPQWVWQNSTLQGNTLNRVSCNAPTDCWAVGSAGTLLHYDGLSWTPTSITFKNLYDISCVSPVFCFAVGQDRLILKYDGTSWAADSFGLSENNDIYAVYCASSSFCMAGGFGSYFYKYDGLSWQRLPPSPTTKPQVKPQHAGFENIYSLKCPDISTCFAAGEQHIWAYSGLVWSEVITEEENIFRDITCRSATSCFAVMSKDGLGNSGSVWEYNGLDWQETLTAPAWLLGVTCEGLDSCTTVGRNGAIYQYDGITWTVTATGVTSVTLNSLACPASGSCLAVGQRGLILTATNNVWQVMVQSVSGPALKDVECVSVVHCYALDSAGNFYDYNGYTWSISSNHGSDARKLACISDKTCYLLYKQRIEIVASEPTFEWPIYKFPGIGWDLQDIACNYSLDCWIVGNFSDNNTGLILRGGQHVTENVAGLDRGLKAVACPASTSCWAVGDSGLLVHYDGVQWQKQPNAPGFIDFTAISCVSVTECRAVGSDNDILTYNGTSWTAGTLPVAIYPTSLACPATNYCYVAGQSGEGVSVLNLQAGSWLTETVNNSYQLSAISCGNRLNCIAVGEQGTILAKVAGLTVTEPTDSGNPATEGTLAHALENALPDYVINFRLPAGNSVVSISSTLPTIPPGITVNGGCNANQPQIVLQGHGAAFGLQLAGQIRLHGLLIKNFGGPQLKTTAPSNRLTCTIVRH